MRQRHDRAAARGSWREYRFALVQIFPLLFSYTFVGLAAGLLLVHAGFSPLWSTLSAFFIYAGSMEIIMVSMLTAKMPLLTVALMTFFINGRHIFYGIGFIDRFRKIGGWRYPYLALTVTDETYSVLQNLHCPEGMDEDRVVFYILSSCHLYWVLACTVGALLGDLLPQGLAGIEFSATAFFVVVVVNRWRASPSHLPALTGLVSGVLFLWLLGPDAFILPALSASMVVLLWVNERKAREEKNHA